MMRANLYVMPARDDIEEGLDEVTGEHREVALRVRALLRALDMTQEAFAESSGDPSSDPGGLRRVEINNAANGKSLAKTQRWSEGVARAVGVDPQTAADYLRGRIELAELRRRRETPRRPQPTTVSDLILPTIEHVARTTRAQHGWTDDEVVAASGLARGLTGADLTEEQALDWLHEARDGRSRWTRRYGGAPIEGDDIGGGLSSVPKVNKRRRS
ncbi:hypothetical protein AKJ09_09835 [Labilithrix luteola]|uniref:Uncharacterized protein n=1 Tax=Labilithrix luteola TaxID=1391654 RepID=A0A0K1QBW9_9BACT|nr:hypothetical protein [Labilithrix luteola]AKV03172.1 hypothetical protein AKJ09_09835 [Labilithrix luteola]